MASPKKDAPLYKKRNLDFTDYAYREAVNRLKYLLADSYTATKRNSICHRHDDSDDTDNVSIKVGYLFGVNYRIFDNNLNRPLPLFPLDGRTTGTVGNIKVSSSQPIQFVEEIHRWIFCLHKSESWRETEH